MSKIKSLDKYTDAMLALAEFKKKHGKTFDQYDSLKIQMQEAEEILKADVKDNHRMNLSNDFVRVTYAPAFSKGYNVEVMLKMLTPKQKKEFTDFGGIVTKQEVNKEKIDEAVEKGIIPLEVKQAAFEEKELSPRVTIKPA
jgi:hypothetical protein